MKIPRFAVLPLVLFAAFAAAQTAPLSPVAPSASHEPATHFDPQHPCALPAICDTFGAPSQHPVLPFTLKPAQSAAIPSVVLSSNLTTIPAPKTCYTVRAYEYSTANPNTGQVRRTGTTTCQPATNFHMKSATLTVQPSSQTR